MQPLQLPMHLYGPLCALLSWNLWTMFSISSTALAPTFLPVPLPWGSSSSKGSDPWRSSIWALSGPNVLCGSLSLLPSAAEKALWWLLDEPLIIFVFSGVGYLSQDDFFPVSSIYPQISRHFKHPSDTLLSKCTTSSLSILYLKSFYLLSIVFYLHARRGHQIPL